MNSPNSDHPLQHITPASDDELSDNPLWLVAIASACLFAILAALASG